MIKVIATLCSLVSPQDCQDHVLVSASFAAISIPACMMGSPELKDMLVDLASDHPNQRIKTWRCEMGERVKKQGI
jgi:hypothetical protein